MRGLLGRLYRGEANIDFIGRRKLWFLLSGAALAVCIGGLVVQGLNFGIEFKGGVQIQAPVAEDGPLADASELEVISTVRDALQPLGAANAQIQVATDDDGRSVIVQTEGGDPRQQDQVVSTVSQAVGATVAETDSQRIGEEWGGEITRKAWQGLAVFVLVVLAFISWRFEWKMALAAILALVHDLVITAGVYSLLGFEVTPSSVIALLTILGYSLYDTVVVFDKVEEDTEALATTGRTTYQDAANQAVNEVVMRSLNTTLATLLPIVALLLVGAGLLGAATLEDLSLALFVGVLTGAYSSIFFATPVLSLWKEREPRYRSVREKVLREARRAPAQPVARPVAASATGREGVEVGKPASSARSGRASGPPVRARAGSKKVKRRKRR